GVPGATFAQGRLVSLPYGGLVLALAAWACRRAPGAPSEEAATWLALLSLGTLAAPYAPTDYATITVLWLLCIDRRFCAPWLAAGIALTAILPSLVALEAPTWIQLAMHVPMQVVALAAPAYALVATARGARVTASAAPGEARPAA